MTELSLGTVRLKVCSTDPKGGATCSLRIRGYISVMAALTFTYFFNCRNNVLLKIIVKLL